MPEVRRFPRQVALAALMLALLVLGGLIGWRIHDHRVAGGGFGATLVLAPVAAG